MRKGIFKFGLVVGLMLAFAAPVLASDRVILGGYSVGVVVREDGKQAAGVGTVTFFDPSCSCYGALGHVIVSGQLGAGGASSDGSVYSTSILRIEPSSVDKVGQKVPAGKEGLIGNVLANTEYGVYGAYHSLPAGAEKSGRLLEVGEPAVGPATMYTVLEGDKVGGYNIVITGVKPQFGVSSKGFTVEITDERLLSSTGGIVQGMSGSPIVQQGKLIGAVTHVIVSNPAKGYGIRAEHMVSVAHEVVSR